MSESLTIFPTLLEAVQTATIDAQISGGCVRICRAERVGCDGRRMPCPDCYTIDPSLSMSVDDHLRQLLRGDS